MADAVFSNAMSRGGMGPRLRFGRERMVGLAVLLFVLVSAVALVGRGELDGEAEGGGSVAFRIQSLLSQLQHDPPMAARAASLHRLGSGEAPPVSGRVGRLGREAETGRAGQLMVQENVANAGAAMGFMERMMGITSPQLFEGMPKPLQHIVLQSAVRAVADADAASAQRGERLSQAQLAALAQRVSEGQPLAQALVSVEASQGLSVANVRPIAQQMKQGGDPGGLSRGLYPVQQLQEEQGQSALEPVQAQSGVDSVEPTVGTVAQEPAETTGDGEEGPLPAGWSAAVDDATGQTYYYNEAGQTTWERPSVDYSSLQPPTSVPAAYLPAEVEASTARPHEQSRFHIHPGYVKATWLVGIAMLACALPCLCFLGLRRCLWPMHKSTGGRGMAGAHTKGVAPTKPLSPRAPSLMPHARGLDDDDQVGTQGGSSASLLPVHLQFLNTGLETLQGGLSDLADVAMDTAAGVAGGVAAPFEVEDTSPYSVVVSFGRDARGCMGMDAAREIYEQCSAKGLKTLLLPSDPEMVRDSLAETQSLANVTGSALFVALVDDEWVQQETHLRLLAAAVHCAEVHAHPRIFVVYTKEFRYREDLALRAFKFTSSTSVAVRTRDSALLPFELLDRVFATKGFWDEMASTVVSDRCLSEEERTAVLGGALPLEARLRSQVNRRRGILEASQAAMQVACIVHSCCCMCPRVRVLLAGRGLRHQRTSAVNTARPVHPVPVSNRWRAW